MIILKCARSATDLGRVWLVILLHWQPHVVAGTQITAVVLSREVMLKRWALRIAQVAASSMEAQWHWLT